MRTLLIALILIAATSALCAAPLATIMVRPESETAAVNAVLSDMAAVHSDDEALVQKLMDIQVCSSPLPGKTRKLLKEQIMVALRREGMSDGTIDLLCPAEITIRRTSSVVSGQSLFEAAREFVLESNSLPGRIEIEPVRLQPDQEVPMGNVQVRVKPGTREARKGQFSVPVEIVVDDQVYRTISVTIIIKVIAPVPISTRPISRLDEVNGTNVVLQERDITSLPSDVLTEMPEQGWTANMAIAEGAVIRRGWVTPPLAVRSGESVIVIVESGSVKVADKGTAVQDGRLGEVVRVRLLGNVREIRGTVTESGVVKITLPGSAGASRRV